MVRNEESREGEREREKRTHTVHICNNNKNNDKARHARQEATPKERITITSVLAITTN
jgi:hypothetical protein